MSYAITFSGDPSEGDLRILREGYRVFTEAQIGAEQRREIAFFLKDGQGAVVGCATGLFGNYGWLWVGLLWVVEELRGRGYGRDLIARTEGEAKMGGCADACLA
ncbi:MAG: GNAT family N-acetyltransferase [Verrucomicrobiales bacterium]